MAAIGAHTQCLGCTHTVPGLHTSSGRKWYLLCRDPRTVEMRQELDQWVSAVQKLIQGVTQIIILLLFKNRTLAIRARGVAPPECTEMPEAATLHYKCPNSSPPI